MADPDPLEVVKVSSEDAGPTSLTARAAAGFSLAADGSFIMMTFSEPVAHVAPTGAIQTLHKTPAVAVSMSPVLAKDLHKVLGQLIKDYEANYGEVPELKPVTGEPK